jgi:hypothetical protein
MVMHDNIGVQVGPKDECYDYYPSLGIEEWHNKHKLYIKKAGK